MRAWLVRVYRSLAGLDVELTPEVRAVFDRMLATDAAMNAAAARTVAEPVLATAPEGMSAADHARYLERHRAAMAAAQGTLLEESMRGLRAERTPEYREAQDALRPVVEALGFSGLVPAPQGSIASRLLMFASISISSGCGRRWRSQTAWALSLATKRPDLP